MTEKEFLQYAEYVKQNFGIKLSKEKKSLLESRLYKLFKNNFSDDMTNGEFYEYLVKDKTGKAREMLADAVTTNHTFFMREAEHFSCFANTVLPYWAEEIKDRDLRVWCAACSSGEESYTLAMIIQEFFSLRDGLWDTTLLATDLSQEILDKAKRGVYPLEAIKTLPRRWQTAYFRRENEDEVKVADIIRNNVLYRKFNLMQPTFPFRKPFHAIFCRNVMIYFDMPTRQALVRKFYDFLRPGGYLFVGQSEMVDRQTAPFSYVMPSVYRRE
jgi:chemotaxis protein methyltransferase CheR